MINDMFEVSYFALSGLGILIHRAMPRAILYYPFRAMFEYRVALKISPERAKYTNTGQHPMIKQLLILLRPERA
jgi:hypothetical protein